MNGRSIVEKIIYEKDGIAKTAELLQAGLTKDQLRGLLNDGVIERVRHGYYQLSNGEFVSEARVLAATIPEGIVCGESALFHYGYSDYTPRAWTIAVPRTVSRPKLHCDYLVLNPRYTQKDELELGKTTGEFDGVLLEMYDRERTICDCFKYRSKMDRELFAKAIHAYVADDEKNLDNLALYAEKMGIYKKVMDLMEVMLCGR